MKNFQGKIIKRCVNLRIMSLFYFTFDISSEAMMAEHLRYGDILHLNSPPLGFEILILLVMKELICQVLTEDRMLSQSTSAFLHLLFKPSTSLNDPGY